MSLPVFVNGQDVRRSIAELILYYPTMTRRMDRHFSRNRTVNSGVRYKETISYASFTDVQFTLLASNTSNRIFELEEQFTNFFKLEISQVFFKSLGVVIRIIDDIIYSNEDFEENARRTAIYNIEIGELRTVETVDIEAVDSVNFEVTRA